MLENTSTGALGGLYKAETMKGLLFGFVISIHTASRFAGTRSRRSQKLIDFLIYIQTPPPNRFLSRRVTSYPSIFTKSFEIE